VVGVNMKVREVGNFIREQRRQTGVSLRKLAKLAGVSNPYLSQIERGLRRPSAEILNGIAKALRISAETLYVQAGILDDRKDRQDLTDAILADRGLTERQRQVLVQVYRSFKEDTERQREVRRRRRSAKPKQAPVLPEKLGGRVESAG
jgi:transcriptional regulator with XRE-family HTH domain